MWRMKILLLIFPSVFCNEKDWVVVICLHIMEHGYGLKSEVAEDIIVFEEKKFTFNQKKKKEFHSSAWHWVSISPHTVLAVPRCLLVLLDHVYFVPHSLGFDYELCIPVPYFIGLTLTSHSAIGKCNL